MARHGDKFFRKRKAKKKIDLTRRKATLSERRRALIVCEGEKTEPFYLRSLVDNWGLTTAEVEVCGECGSAPKSVVNFGKDKLNIDSDFDLIFFVFDRDSHPDYDDALSLINELQRQRKFKRKMISAITSNPCFEIWFLMHYEPHSKP